MPGTNGPPTFTSAEFAYPSKTFAEIRLDLIRRLGFSAMASNPPPGLNELIDSFIIDAYEQLYERYPMLRNLRWWQIDVVANERFYDIPYEGAYSGAQTDIAINSGSPDQLVRTSGDWTADGFTSGMSIRISGSDQNDGLHTVGSTVNALSMDLSTSTTVISEAAGNRIIVQQDPFKALDQTEINEVWLRDNTAWHPLVDGIDPGFFQQTTPNIPGFYEVREYIELWPIPDKAYTLYLKGHMGMAPLQVDTDRPSIDERSIFLMALANAKAHYRQPDSGTYYRQLEVHIGKLNADTFTQRRFVPGEKPRRPASYPQVTWPR